MFSCFPAHMIEQDGSSLSLHELDLLRTLA
jgi:hypothetical protein